VTGNFVVCYFDFKSGQTAAHTSGEYVSRDGTAHTQTVESFFAVLKRRLSEQHLGRYVDEFAFRWNPRSALGIEDAERASGMLKGAVCKRVTCGSTN
jgi:hypothetical protein